MYTAIAVKTLPWATIAGEEGSGIICLNGAAARMVSTGDKVIIMSYARMTPEEVKGHFPQDIRRRRGHQNQIWGLSQCNMVYLRGAAPLRMTPEEVKDNPPKVVFVDEENKITSVTRYEKHGALKEVWLSLREKK